MLPRMLTGLALALGAQGAPEVPQDSCGEERVAGPFQIRTILRVDESPIVLIQYAVPANHISSAFQRRGDGPFINLDYRISAGAERWSCLDLMNFDRLFPRPRFPIRSMTMTCGRNVTLVGDTTRQPFPLNGAFTRESGREFDDCLAALRRSGRYRLMFEEQEGDMRSVRIEGFADFASAMRQGERMARRGMARARSGRCQVDPPPIAPF